jgi:mono/diheme cytochrome c family protein
VKALVVIVAVLAGARIAQAADGEPILAKYCVRCHGPARAESDFGFAGETSRLVAAGMIVPGDPDASVIVKRIELAEMPPAGKRPSKAELATLRQWITEMKPASPTRFRDDEALARILAADADALDPTTRDNTRWLSFAHLVNAGVPDAELDHYRNALAILLASLTWAPAPKVMVPVDRERTVYRIDLRELGWSRATWDTIRAAYPYGVARGHGVPDVIRADWFVATASRGALYHAILGLPDHEDQLLRMLGIDHSTTVDARAGFNNSGVSVNNRVIERRATRYGAYWRSYDFASSIGVANVFRHPLDFVPAGGELIFNLPDGMQAYMLVNATGKRIDKAPTAIVSDPRRRDRAVETALSCFGCHGAGIVVHADQVRDSSTDPRVLDAYAEADALASFYADDSARFATALATVGATPQPDAANEPITILTARYEDDLDLRTAAAELGLEASDLSSRINRSSTARRDLAALTTTGGTIKRDAWQAAFPRIVRALRIGLPFTPETGQSVAPTVWIDRAHRTWFAVSDVGDRDAAERSCRIRGGTLPRSKDLATAAAQGLAGALRLGDDRAWTRDRKLDATNQRYGLLVDIGSAVVTRATPAERHGAICIQEASP